MHGEESNPYDSRPTSERIAAEIRAAILSGDCPPGTSIGSTNQLMARFKAANQTVQRVVDILRAEHAVVSLPGRGVYALHRPEAPPARNPQPMVRLALLSVGIDDPPADARRALRARAGAKAICRHTLTVRDAVPIELAWRYYPIELAQDSQLAVNAFIPGGTRAALAELGHTPTLDADELMARLPTGYESSRLAMPPSVPVVRVLRTAVDAEGEPVEVSVFVRPGHLRWSGQVPRSVADETS